MQNSIRYVKFQIIKLQKKSLALVILVKKYGVKKMLVSSKYAFERYMHAIENYIDNNNITLDNVDCLPLIENG